MTKGAPRRKRSGSIDSLKSYQIVFKKSDEKVDKGSKSLSRNRQQEGSKGDSESNKGSRLSSLDENVLRKKRVSLQEKQKALKYLQESRKDLRMSSRELHSVFSKRII